MKSYSMIYEQGIKRYPVLVEVRENIIKIPHLWTTTKLHGLKALDTTSTLFVNCK